MKRSLYSRESLQKTRVKNHRFKNESYDVKSEWSDENEKNSEKKPFFLKEKRGMAFVTKFFIVSILFFLVASGVAFYKFYWGANTISANNIEISIIGPVSVSGGEKISLDIRVDNKNKTDLNSVDLKVDYPEGTRAVDNLDMEIKRIRNNIGDIPKEGSVNKRVEAILFGEEKTKKEIKVTLEYRVSGSSAIFYKEKIYEVVISDSPVSIEVSGFQEVKSGQALDFSVTIVSNSSGPIRNLLLKAEYPFGFVFTESSEKSLDSNNNLWSMGNLSPGQRKTVKIYGKLQGQDGEDKVLRFTAGIAGSKDEKTIDIPLAISIAEISIKKPFIGIQVALDGSVANEFVSKSSKIIRADIAWTNNLTIPIRDMEIKIKIKGNALNKSTVSAERGFYKSLDDIITFDKTSILELESIPPGANGNLSFSFGSLISYSGGSSIVSDPSIFIDVVAIGKRLEGENVPQEVLYSATKIIKIETDARLSSRAIHWSGPFQNKGFMPPKADNETTYTVIWTITNTSNKIRNGKVTATLPSYVKWLSQTSPVLENISFNSARSEVIWDVGEIEAGAGIDGPPREISFQVSLLPSLSQVGQAPIILNESTLTGKDDFTSSSVGDTRSSLTTSLKTDPDFKYEEDKVIQ